MELSERVDAALAPLGIEAGAIRVRTFHALGLEILRDAGAQIGTLVDREVLLRQVAPWADDATLMELDGVVSRLKIELGVSATDVAADPEAGPLARAFVDYERAVAAAGGLDFDDLVLGAIERLEGDGDLLARWRARCAHLLVDEVQDVDRAQLRLALLLAAPANRILLVGDDDQSIYGWRLADVRRVLGLDAVLSGLTRVDLEVNYRCPTPVVERAVRLVEHNHERFAKRIRSGPAATGTLVLAPDAADDAVRLERAMRRWPDDGSTRAVLARTNRELIPAVVVAMAAGIPFRASRLELPLEDPSLDDVLADARARARPDEPPLLTLGRCRRSAADGARGGHRGDAPRLGTGLHRPGGLHRRHRGRPTPARRASTRRRAPHAGDGARDEGPRVRPRRRHRDGGGPLPERPGRGRRAGSRPGLRGGTSPRVRGVDPGAALADAPVRPDRPLAVPPGGVQCRRARADGYDIGVTSLPSLGPRGEGWVVLQVILFLLAGLAGWFGPAWAGVARVVGVAIGALLMLGGGVFVVRGALDLRSAMTPLPYPRAEASLVQTGVYARVRHPIYGGVIIGSVGWGLVTASIPALAIAVVIWAFFLVKSVREEAWLVERFPDYPAYQSRTRRLIPWIG